VAQDLQQIKAVEAQLRAAIQRGNDKDVERLWEQMLQLDPANANALMAIGQRAFRNGDGARAREMLQRLCAVDGSDQQQWINLAIVCQTLGDEEGEDAALKGALKVAPSDLLALLLRGGLRERQGKVHEAASSYGGAVAVAPPMDQLNEQLRPTLAHAIAYRDRYNTEFGNFLDSYLAPFYKELDGASKVTRFRESVDIMFGRKKRYDSQSSMFHVQGLAPTSFFERSEFPWLAAIEAQTDAIRAEFLELVRSEEGFQPYLEYGEDQPHNQFAELNNSMKWTAFHLIRDGKPVEPNAARCPVTMAALGGAPQPDQPGRTPNAMFSLLRPGVTIPAHTGVTNSRLVVHVPLIIPPNCAFRVGNDTREWKPGTAFVFDDTIEHEAWNKSDELRVILMFDIWHPHLSEAERHLVTAMTKGINTFAATAGGFEL
jgi:aspartyl/asparaginyl beta-hydroxylase (cupin superfamily)